MSNQVSEFASMNPHEVYRLYGLNPEKSTAVKEYLNSLTHYTTEWDQGNAETKQKVYAMMSNIDTLTLTIHGFVNQTYYLRPSIKTLYMNFDLYLCQDREYNVLEFFRDEAFIGWFQSIEKYLVENPNSQLEELHIQFSPEVELYLTIPDYHTVDYDEIGPIYEDEDWVLETEKHNPSEYFFALSKKGKADLKKIGKALLKLLAVREWKAITLPYHFPSAATIAEKYPFAKLTDKIDENGAYERIFATIKESHIQHREEHERIKV